MVFELDKGRLPAEFCRALRSMNIGEETPLEGWQFKMGGAESHAGKLRHLVVTGPRPGMQFILRYDRRENIPAALVRDLRTLAGYKPVAHRKSAATGRLVIPASYTKEVA